MAARPLLSLNPAALSDIDPRVLAALANSGATSLPLGSPLDPNLGQRSPMGTPGGTFGAQVPGGNMPAFAGSPASPSPPRFTQPGGMFANRGGSSAPAAGDPYQPATGTPPQSGLDMPAATDQPSVLGIQPLNPQMPDMAPLDTGVGKIHPHFFDKTGLGSKLINGLGAAADYYLANQGYPGAMAAVQARLNKPRLDAENAYRNSTLALRLAELQRLAAKDQQPEIKVANGQIYSIPADGSAPTQLAHVPTGAEQYAASLGLQEGDDGYDDAVRDYVLRGSGPSATQNRVTYEDARQQNRIGLEGVRQGNRVALRGVPTYGDTHARPAASRTNLPPRTTGNVYAPILAKVAAGQPLTPAEQQALSYFGGRHGGGRAGGGGIPLAGGAPAPSRPPVRVTTPQQARALPVGTVFQTPDGRVKVR